MPSTARGRARLSTGARVAGSAAAGAAGQGRRHELAHCSSPATTDPARRAAAARGRRRGDARRRPPTGSPRCGAGSAAPLVLVGADVAERAGRAPRRGDAPACTSWPGAGPGATPCRTALALGAENVAALPASRRVGGRAAHRPRRRRPARRPAGRGRRAARAAPAPRRSRAPSARSRPGRGTAVVVDADPLGPGPRPGARPGPSRPASAGTSCATTGRLGARSLREALPRRAGLGALTWYAGRSAAAAGRSPCARCCRRPGAVTTWSSSTCPRMRGPAVDEVVARCDLVWSSSSPTVAGLASTDRAWWPGSAEPGRCGLVRARHRSRPRRRRPGHRPPAARRDGRPARARRVGRPRARAGALPARPAGPAAREVLAQVPATAAAA